MPKSLALFLPALATLLIPLLYFPPVTKIFSVILFAALVYASYIDLQRMEIPDRVSIGLFPLGALLVLIQCPDLLLQRLFGAILVLLLMAGFSRLFYRLRGKEGLGFGDVKLAASATVWIGLPLFPVMIFLAAASGLIASFYRFAMWRQRQPDARIAFGPHLAASIWIVWISTALGLPETGF